MKKVATGPASFELHGEEEMARKLSDLAQKAPLKMSAALYHEANVIMTESKAKFVPVDTGNLRSSGKVDQPSWKGDTLSITLHYGDASAPYALAIHEHPSAASPPSWEGKPIEGIYGVRTGAPWTIEGEGKGPKYLERPIRSAEKDLLDKIIKRMAI